MSYLVDTTGVLRLSDSQYIDSSMTVAWAEYRAWLAANTPEPIPALYRLLQVGVLRIADGLHVSRDMPEYAEYRAWVKAGGVPEPKEAPSVPEIPLPEAKRRRISMLTDTALTKTAEILPEFGNLSTLIVLRELYLSIAPAARQPTAKLTSVIAVYIAWQDAVDEVKACSTVQCVIGVTPNWP